MPTPSSVQSYEAIPDFGVLYDAVPAYAARTDVPFYVSEAKRARGSRSPSRRSASCSIS